MSVRDKLVELDLFFKSCLDRIPSDAYFSQASSYKDLDDSISVSQKKALKKRQKLNPKLMMKTSEMLETIEEEEDAVDEVDSPDTNKEWQVEQLKPEQSASLQELQQKLKTKMDEIKAKRGSTKRTPEEQLAIQKKRKLERARYKAKKKQRLNPTQAKALVNGEIGATGIEPVKTKAPSPPINSNGKVVFSKFEFGNSISGIEDKSEAKRQVKKKRKTEELLRVAEKKKQKLSELKENDPAKADEVVEQETWSKAILKSKGVKIKDDVKLLKKTIKRKEDQKKQSREKWDERHKKEDLKKKVRQNKRDQNIQQRKMGKMNKSKGKKKMKGF